MDSSASDEDKMAYPLAGDIVKRAPANVRWERLDMLYYVGVA